jgi:cytochrome c2
MMRVKTLRSKYYILLILFLSFAVDAKETIKSESLKKPVSSLKGGSAGTKVWTLNDSLWDLRLSLGAHPPQHISFRQNNELARIGEKIVNDGILPRPGAKKQSLYYKCVDCHTVDRADEEASPNIQGSTFWGIVNRESFYNEVYQKKYGSLVKDAADDLREAVQVCSTTCSQGDRLTEKELDAILAYFWSKELKIKDLQLSKPGPDENEAEIQDLLSKVNKAKPSDATELLARIDSGYTKAAPATLHNTSETEEALAGLTGDWQRGKEIWTTGCMRCHNQEEYMEEGLPYFTSDGEQYRDPEVAEFDVEELPELLREGTNPPPFVKGYYMPYFTSEKLSDQGIADLNAFLSSHMESKGDEK